MPGLPRRQERQPVRRNSLPQGSQGRGAQGEAGAAELRRGGGGVARGGEEGVGRHLAGAARERPCFFLFLLFSQEEKEINDKVRERRKRERRKRRERKNQHKKLTEQQRRRDDPRERPHGEVHPGGDQLRPERVDARLAGHLERQQALEETQEKRAERGIVEKPPGDGPKDGDLVRRQDRQGGDLAVPDHQGGDGAASEGRLCFCEFEGERERVEREREIEREK